MIPAPLAASRLVGAKKTVLLCEDTNSTEGEMKGGRGLLGFNKLSE